MPSPASRATAPCGRTMPTDLCPSSSWLRLASSPPLAGRGKGAKPWSRPLPLPLRSKAIAYGVRPPLRSASPTTSPRLDEERKRRPQGSAPFLYPTKWGRGVPRKRDGVGETHMRQLCSSIGERCRRQAYPGRRSVGRSIPDPPCAGEHRPSKRTKLPTIGFSDEGPESWLRPGRPRQLPEAKRGVKGRRRRRVAHPRHEKSLAPLSQKKTRRASPPGLIKLVF